MNYKEFKHNIIAKYPIKTNRREVFDFIDPLEKEDERVLFDIYHNSEDPAKRKFAQDYLTMAYIPSMYSVIRNRTDIRDGKMDREDVLSRLGQTFDTCLKNYNVNNPDGTSFLNYLYSSYIPTIYSVYTRGKAQKDKSGRDTLLSLEDLVSMEEHMIMKEGGENSEYVSPNILYLSSVINKETEAKEKQEEIQFFTEKLLSLLSVNARNILITRYGLRDGRIKTMEETARCLGIKTSTLKGSLNGIKKYLTQIVQMTKDVYKYSQMGMRDEEISKYLDVKENLLGYYRDMFNYLYGTGKLPRRVFGVANSQNTIAYSNKEKDL